MLNAALRPLSDLDDRDLPRYRLLTQAVARSADTSDFAVTMRDLSATGLLIEAKASLRIGSTILLSLPNAQEVAATVVWSSGDYHGAQFAAPLREAAVRACLADSKVVWPAFADREAPTAAPAVNQPAAMLAAVAQAYEEPTGGSDLSLALRMRILLGASAVLWSAIIGGAWTLLG